MNMVTVSLNGESITVEESKALETGDMLHNKHGGVPLFEKVTPNRWEDNLEVSEKAFSDFGPGNQIIDQDARVRIEALQSELKGNGVNVNAANQLYATGTRMAEVGYKNQAARKVEHDKKLSIEETASKLRQAVIDENREDVTISAREFGNAINVNGKLTAFGLAMTEQALIGLATRLDSTFLGHIKGIRNRIIEETKKSQKEKNQSKINADKEEMAHILRHECLANGDALLKLRTRKSIGDIFAIVSPTYGIADAPEVVDQVLKQMPKDAKGTWAYDPISTAWELRADVWTPTPVAEQCVGEPFNGYVSFQSRDNGTSRFHGGGGVIILACLNAGTYVANDSNMSRVHRGKIMYDIEKMMHGALKSIDTLCNAWGTNRKEVVELPKKLTIEDAIPGFWRYLLTDRRSDLTGILTGRTEGHIQGLTKTFHEERRDKNELVRADFAQGWTKYIQNESTLVRREAESAIGDWLVNNGRIGYESKERL